MTHSDPNPLVGIIMGSQSDWETMKEAHDILHSFGIPHEVKIVSAHRTPDRLVEYAKTAKGRGLKVIIAGAGGAAHLPGMAASMTPLPVLGVPVESKALSGMDSLLSIVQMPGGIPVGTLAIGKAGAKNAGLLATAILATSDANLASALDTYRSDQTNAVAQSPKDWIKTPIMDITLGILGGGQLGRMSAMAAARLGIKAIIFTDEINSPASFVSSQTIVSDYSDKAALEQFAKLCDFITYEFENIPVETVRYLKTLKPVYPDDNLLEVAQDRIAEKTYLNKIGIPTAKFDTPRSGADLKDILKEWNTSDCTIKTTRFGYDGKGQARISSTSDIDTIWTHFKGEPLIIEELIAFDHELSVIIARDQFGNMETYGPMLNEHENHILSRTIIPAPLPEAIHNDAISLAKTLAEKLNLIGVLTLEMFLTKDGKILANEIAPRTHNSGHWSIDACAVSQFENHVRTVCGLPVGAPARHSDAEMLNLIGSDIEKAPELLKNPGACVHLYGKSEAREGRKMGHVTFLKKA